MFPSVVHLPCITSFRCSLGVQLPLLLPAAAAEAARLIIHQHLHKSLSPVSEVVRRQTWLQVLVST